jgi:hypothetical protein
MFGHFAFDLLADLALRKSRPATVEPCENEQPDGVRERPEARDADVDDVGVDHAP